jgi:quercetin dioxygenase-like cupin family protein
MALVAAGDRFSTRHARETNMAIALNATSVAAEPIAPGVVRQRLITKERVKDTSVLIDRLVLAAGTTAQFELSAKSLAWLHLLEGEATLRTLCTERMSANHSAFLPPGFTATLSTETGASLLYAEIPDVGRVDPGFPAEAPLFMVMDWTREAVFETKRDGRKRVALVSPGPCRTKAMRAAMAIYPAGAAAPTCHHEGADSFVYVLEGQGTASANRQSHSLRQDDLICFRDREPHHLQAARDSKMRFLAFQVPGEFKTVWADPNTVSAWRSTDRDINGRETAVDEKRRRVFAKVFGNPALR